MKKAAVLIIGFLTLCYFEPQFGYMVLAVLFGLCLTGLCLALMLWLAALLAKAFGVPIVGLWVLKKRQEKKQTKVVSGYPAGGKSPKNFIPPPATVSKHGPSIWAMSGLKDADPQPDATISDLLRPDREREDATD